MLKIVLLGAPGSGKGTQSAKLVERYDVPQVSTGDLLRNAVAEQTELGKKAKAAMDAGELVSDDVVVGMMRERLTQADRNTPGAWHPVREDAESVEVLAATIAAIRHANFLELHRDWKGDAPPRHVFFLRTRT